MNNNSLKSGLKFWRKKLEEYTNKIKENYTYEDECFIHMINEKIAIIEEELKNES